MTKMQKDLVAPVVRRNAGRPCFQDRTVLFPFAFLIPLIPSVLTTVSCNEEMPFLFATIPLSRAVIV